MKRDTNKIGDMAEAQCLAALVRAGKTVLIPFGSADDYDLVIEENEKFFRVQCKKAQLINGAVKVKAYSLHQNNGKYRNRSYENRADLIAAYCEELNKTYLMPVESSQTSFYLRVDPTKNNQKKRIRWAKDYEI